MVRAVIFDMYETLITQYNCPLYFSEAMAADAGMDVEKFLPYWRATENDRWVGKITFEDTVAHILKENNCYSEDTVRQIAEKRTRTKEEAFKHLHPQITVMLKKIREKGIRTGLISNCFSEEVPAIRQSILFPYFDTVCLSYEERIMKPDPEIYRRCMEKLQVRAGECIYVGDGGCMELETAADLGMTALQAAWYLRDDIKYQTRRKKEFKQLEQPEDLIRFL